MTSSGQTRPHPESPATAAAVGGERAERALVAAAQRDPQQFAVLYDRYFNSVYSYVYYRVGHHESAEDIVGQTFERALRGLPGFAWRDGGFRAWLFRIASNAVTDHFRRRGRAPQLQPYDDLLAYEPGRLAGGTVETPDESALRAERRQEILQAVAGLSPVQQEAVILKFREGLSNQEIAAATGRSPTAVSSLLHRAMQALRERLVDEGG